MDSRTTTCVTPGWSSTSRSKRRRALGPKPAFGFSGPAALPVAVPNAPSLPRSTRFPEMATLSTAGASAPSSAVSRSARTSGQRRSASAVDPKPSVIESPSVTTIRVAVDAAISTRDRYNQDYSVASTGISSAPL